MNLSVSDLLPFLDCTYAGQQRLLLNAWSGSTGALRLGTALHEHMEWLLHGRFHPEPQAALQDSADQKSLDSMRAAVVGWNPPWQLQGIELQLSAPLFETAGGAPAVPIPSYMLPPGEEPTPPSSGNGPTIVGTLDALVFDEKDRHWSLQWKTIGKGRNVGAELERVRMSPHELTYHWLVKQALGIDLSGTIVGLFRKSLTKKEMEQGVPVFQLYELPRASEEALKAFYEDIGPAFNDLYDSLTTEGWQDRKNWRACYGPFGNSPCPLFDHCHLGLPADTLGLIPLEDRYSALSPNTD